MCRSQPPPVSFFDEISAYTTSGPRSLTSGDTVTMTDQNGNAFATPETLNDWGFKVVGDSYAGL